jgi:hypothetical protein
LQAYRNKAKLLKSLTFVFPEGATEENTLRFFKINVKEYLYQPRPAPRAVETSFFHISGFLLKSESTFREVVCVGGQN